MKTTCIYFNQKTMQESAKKDATHVQRQHKFTIFQDLNFLDEYKQSKASQSRT